MHHYFVWTHSVHEEGSKVGGPLEGPMVSDFGSRLSEWNALSNSHYTYVPLSTYSGFDRG